MTDDFTIREQANKSAEKHNVTFHTEEYVNGYYLGYKAGFHECEKEHEWHYVKDGDVPKKSISVLAYFKGEDVSLLECLYIPDEGFKHPIFSEWYEPTAWIEIEKILPKELEKC